MNKLSDLKDLSNFSVLVEAYYAKVFYHCIKLTKNNHDASDITQDTFTRAFINIKNLREIDSFGAWIFTICNNEIKRFYKKSNRQEIVSNISNISDISGTLKPKQYNSLYYAVDMLDDKYKSLIILKYFAEFSVKEISTLTSLDEKLVKSRLYDARKKLKNILSDSGIYNFNNLNEERKKEIMSTAKLLDLGSQVISCMSVWGQKELLKCAEKNEKFSNEVLSELAKIEKGSEFTLECGGKLSYDELIKILSCCDEGILYRMNGQEYRTWRSGGDNKLLSDVADYLGTGAFIESVEFILCVPSIVETVNWYKKHLGWVGDGEQKDEDYGHTIIRVYDENGNMSRTFKGFHLWKICEVNTEVTKGHCFVFVTGLEALRDKIKSTGWEKISDISKSGWGVNQFEVEDLNGFKLLFSEWDCE